MRDHPVPGSPWVPQVLRGMLAAFDHEVEQEAFADLQFRLPPVPRGPAPHPGPARPSFVKSPLDRTGAPVHPSGFGIGHRARGLGHV